MNKLLQSILRRHEPDVVALSARLDGRLAPDEAREADTHLAGCAVCSARFEGLRLARARLGAMPDIEHPRSFRLRVADVERAIPPPARSGGQFGRWLPALAGVTAVIFIAIVASDVARNSSSSSSMRAESARVADSGTLQTANGYVATTAADKSLSGADAAAPAAPEPATVGTASATTDGAAGAAAPGPGDASANAGTVVAAPNLIAAPEIASPTPELFAAGRRPTSDDDTDSLRAAEIVTAVIAVCAGAAAIGWRMRRRSM